MSGVILLLYMLQNSSALVVPRPLLKTADNFAMLAPTTITCTVADTVYCDMGVRNVGGTIGAVNIVAPYVRHINNAVAIRAYDDFWNALNDVWLLRFAGASLLGGTADISNREYKVGFYMTTTTLAVAASYVRMNAQNNPNAIFVFIAVSFLSISQIPYICFAKI